MPREKQKRGRRAEEKKRKREEAPEEAATKRPKPSTDNEQQVDFENNEDYIALDDGNGEGQNEYEGGHPSGDMPFYGLLDTEEQEYFSRASELLELNQFQDAEERQLFVESVYREAKGKELKIACSQSCSRLMEKLISMSDVHQIRRLFGKFLGHFLHLVQHRFASHCCETLFIHAAPAVTEKPSKKKKKEEKIVDVEEGEEEDEVPDMSMADMFLTVVEELQENWGYLLTERFASHTIRVLLLVLAGEQVDVASNKSVVASKKKERLGGTPTAESPAENAVTQRRPVPQSFEDTLKKIMKDMTAVLDNTYLRALATHPVGNPVLQVLLSLELSHFGKSSAKDENSIIRRLIPDETLEEGSESALFVRGLLYDPVGSRLLETIVRCAPGKLFKSLYKNGIKDRIGSLARNETASYVVLRVLERLGKDDLQAAVELILPEAQGLVERSRLVVPRVLIERCVVRGVNTASIAKALEAAYDKDPATRLDQMLKFKPASQQESQEEPQPKGEPQREPENPTARNAEKTHGSLLAQTMLGVSGPLSQMIYSSLLAKSSEDLLQMAMDPISSRVLQQALTLPTSTAQFRRQFTSRFLGHMNELALHSSGSHVADALWPATKDIFFVKERFAQELSQNELTLRDSFVGRAVWRNWSMDLYKRRPGEWKAKAKGLGPQTENGAGSAERPKSRIELARARFAERTAEKTEPAKKMESGQKSVAAKS